jgi:hypothetical protein
MKELASSKEDETRRQWILSALSRNFHEGLLVSWLVGFLFFLSFCFCFFFFNLVLRVLYHREVYSQATRGSPEWHSVASIISVF